MRIVSLVPSITETVCDLGLEESVVGCTSFCVHPKSIRKTAVNIGGTKDASFEKIMALKPTHVIVDPEENSAQLIKNLQSHSGLEVLSYFPIEILDAVAMVEDLGVRFGKRNLARAWSEKVRRELADFKKMRPLRYCYFIWRDPWMVAGDKTFVSKMLALAGFRNVVITSENFADRYPVFDLNNCKDVDVFLFSSEPFPFKERHIEEFTNATKSLSHKALIDGQVLSWYGTRTLAGIQYVKKLVHSWNEK